MTLIDCCIHGYHYKFTGCYQVLHLSSSKRLLEPKQWPEVKSKEKEAITKIGE